MKSYYLIPILCLATFSMARAHAFLDHAEPRVGSVVTGSPPVVKIWFTEELEGAFSKIEVFDTNKQEIDRKDSKVDAADKSIMAVSVPGLAPGTYKVVWNAVATDTHHTTGTFTFEVKKP